MNWKLPYTLFIILTGLLGTAAYHKIEAADINYYKAHRYFEKGLFDESIPYYINALDIKPSYFNALKELAHAYQWTEKYKDAIDVFKKALDLKPQDINLLVSTAETYAWMGQYSRAITIFKQILDKAKDVNIERKLAEVYIWDDQYKEAETLLLRILRKNPKDDNAKLLLAQVLTHTGRAKQAIGIYKKLLTDLERQ